MDQGECGNNGRRFTDIDEQSLGSLLTQVERLEELDTWITEDRRPDRADERWLNSLLRLVACIRGYMVRHPSTGGAADPVLPRLLAAIRRANQIDLAVAFIKTSGLSLLFDPLADPVTTRGARLRILTSEYLDVTDPQALRRFMLWAERGADVRLFEAADQSFHLKTYKSASAATASPPPPTTRASELDRSESLEQLERGDLQVIFSVDLFDEGVDLPAVDRIMMLRRTESKVLFLQQLGRGLRRHDGKEQLVVLDFIDNHKGFVNKPQALLGIGSSYRTLADFARRPVTTD